MQKKKTLNKTEYIRASSSDGMHQNNQQTNCFDISLSLLKQTRLIYMTTNRLTHIRLFVYCGRRYRPQVSSSTSGIKYFYANLNRSADLMTTASHYEMFLCLVRRYHPTRPEHRDEHAGFISEPHKVIYSLPAKSSLRRGSVSLSSWCFCF